MGEDMPFRSLDPVDLARAIAALDAAWSEVADEVPAGSEEQERTRLAYIISSLIVVADDEGDLARRAIERFNKTAH